MTSSVKLLGVAVLLAAASGCDSGRHSAAGFRLPDYGDPEKGKAAFLELRCNTCHSVSGMDLPAPTMLPAVPVVLGGEVERELSDGYLVTSIINPSYRLAGYPINQIAVGRQSRMPHYADQLTVRQLTDIVAFLQSRYKVRPLPIRYPYR